MDFINEALFAQAIAYEKKQLYTKAFVSYQEAAENGHAASQTAFATLLLGVYPEVPQNKLIAYDWLLKAAEQGNSKAMYNLGQMHEYADGIPLNLEQALKWYKDAKEQNYTQATIKVQRVLEKQATLQNNTPPSKLTLSAPI